MKIKKDLIIFDIDGVLIDVRKSYRKAVIAAVHAYLNNYLGLKIKKAVLSDRIISEFKKCSGFNNDWDLTAAAISYIVYVEKKKENIDFERFISHVEKRGGGLRGVKKVLGKLPREVEYTGDVKTGNTVKRIFQEFYFGSAGFKKVFGLTPVYFEGAGLVSKESLCIERKLLAKLRMDFKLGIATGRDSFESNMALEMHKIKNYFDVITTDEDIKTDEKIFGKKGLSKPNPYILEKTVKKSRCKGRILFLGDTRDDIMAASSCRMYDVISIGCVYAVNNKRDVEKTLLASGAAAVIRRPSELPEVINCLRK